MDLAQHGSPAIDAERVEASFLCIDVVGFTRMTERLGDLRSLCIMRQAAQHVRIEGKRHGAELLEVRGDAFLLAFERPGPALDCALRISAQLTAGFAEPDCTRLERLELRTSLHRGDALRDECGYFGASLILAYRLLERIDPGQIAMSSEFARSLSQARVLDAASSDAFRPKGMERSVTFWRLRAMRVAEAASASTAVREQDAPPTTRRARPQTISTGGNPNEESISRQDPRTTPSCALTH